MIKIVYSLFASNSPSDLQITKLLESVGHLSQEVLPTIMDFRMPAWWLEEKSLIYLKCYQIHHACKGKLCEQQNIFTFGNVWSANSVESIISGLQVTSGTYV